MKRPPQTEHPIAHRPRRDAGTGGESAPRHPDSGEIAAFPRRRGEDSDSSTLPPVAKIVPRRFEVHGISLEDEYYWLRQRDDSKVREYLEAENRYTAEQTAHTEELRETLYQEMVGRIQETDQSVPYRLDDFFYYHRTEEGRQYPIFCRRAGSLEAEEEILLDVNELAGEREYLQLGALRVSPDHRLLAYSYDVDGSELYTARILDLATGDLLEDEITGAAADLEWGNDNRTLFYALRNAARRPDRLLRHVLGADPAADELLWHEEDEKFFLGITKSRSRRFLFLSLESATTTEVHFLSADRPGDPFRLFSPRRSEVEYGIYHQGPWFYIRTNDGAKNFRLLRTPVDRIEEENWQGVIAASEETWLGEVEMFADFMAVHERRDGLQRIRVRAEADGAEHYVRFDEPAFALWGGGSREYDTRILRFTYSSLTTPDSVFDYDMATRERQLRKRKPVLGGFDSDDYVTERLFATAEDGTRIPISLAYRKDGSGGRGGARPCYLQGYGSYGVSVPTTFSSSRLSLLDRGFVYAVAHIRGGGEMGERWHDAGKLLHKRNTFTDFVAAAEHLTTAGYTTTDRLVAAGGSAGGLLIGAVVNLRPDLFQAVVASVPFVDVINTMLDPTIPLTVTEYEEWGDPNDPEAFRYMLSYSPYDNVEEKDYPAMLVMAGLNDSRVQYWEPAKWVARLRARKTDDRPLLLKTHMGAGHSGASGRYDALREHAFRFAFLIDVLGSSA